MVLLIASGFTEIEIEDAESRLHRAIDFYPDAFDRIDTALSESRQQREPIEAPLRFDLVIKVLFETAIAAVIWLAIPVFCFLTWQLLLVSR